VNANMDASTTDKAAVLDLEAYPTAKKLVQRCHQFFAEVQDLYVDLSPSLPSPGGANSSSKIPIQNNGLT
jgi:hypothetical protein